MVGFRGEEAKEEIKKGEGKELKRFTRRVR